jgi:hypothetical protein
MKKLLFPLVIIAFFGYVRLQLAIILGLQIITTLAKLIFKHYKRKWMLMMVVSEIFMAVVTSLLFRDYGNYVKFLGSSVIDNELLLVWFN